MSNILDNRFPYAFTHFKVAYLGLFAPQVWIYCLLHRFDVPLNTSLIAPIFYAACAFSMLACVVLSYSTDTRIIQKIAGWPAAIVAGLSTPFVLLTTYMPEYVVYLAAGIGGVAIAWVYLSWIRFYAALDIRNVIACVFGAMIVSSVFKLWIDVTPPIPAAVIMGVLPLVSPFLLRRASAQMPPVDKEPRILFDSAKASIPYLILTGVAVCSFIIGVSPRIMVPVGGISAEIVALVQHVIEAIVGGLAIWWVFCFNGKLHFTNLWRSLLVLTATALLLLPHLDASLLSWSLAMMYIAQTLLIALVWITLADAAHHSSVDASVIFGACWAVYALANALGSFLGVQFSNFAQSSYAIPILAYAITLVAVFALNERSFIESRMFTDLEEPETEDVPVLDTIEAGCKVLGNKFNLTDREIDIVTLLCKGRSKSYIAQTLFISENTVRSHSRHIYQKLDVHSKQEILDMLATL